MPSPFPGMDPYIEAAEVWSDFHGGVASEIRGELNRLLRPRYIARLTPRVAYEMVEIEETRSVRPDVGVWRSSPSEGSAPSGPAALVAPVVSAVPSELPVRLYSVEILETGSLRLVTAIEVLSPVNKRPGHEAHDEYLRKRRALLRSEAHLIEIDLLRGGERPPLQKPVPEAPYYITLARADRRPTVEVWPIAFQSPLPAIPVPLLAPDPDVALDMSAMVASVYERGAYERLIDYRLPPPPPPLSPADAAWVDEHLRTRALR